MPNDSEADLTPRQKQALAFLLRTLVEAADALPSPMVQQLCVLYCRLVQHTLYALHAVDYAFLLRQA